MSVTGKIFLGLGICFITSCRKNVIKVNSDFQGIWNSEYFGPNGGITISIGDNGRATYYRMKECHICKEENHSGIARIKDNEFKIGTKKMAIETYPMYDTIGNYIMNLDGSLYYAVYMPVGAHTIVSGTSVTFYWGLASSGDGGGTRNIEYRPMPSLNWTVVDRAPSPGEYTVNNLQPITTYEWRIRSTMGSHSSQYTPLSTFTTQ